MTHAETVDARLAAYFRLRGVVRRQNRERLAREGHEGYKKGDEVRLVATTTAELEDIRRRLREAGFKAGRPYRNGSRHVQPIYGRDQVARFLSMVESVDPE